MTKEEKLQALIFVLDFANAYQSSGKKDFEVSFKNNVRTLTLIESNSSNFTKYTIDVDSDNIEWIEKSNQFIKSQRIKLLNSLTEYQRYLLNLTITEVSK